jgi:hypothetical protein
VPFGTALFFSYIGSCSRNCSRCLLLILNVKYSSVFIGRGWVRSVLRPWLLVIFVNERDKLTQLVCVVTLFKGTIVSPDKLNTQLPDLIVGGYSITVAKRRRGQQEFRLALLKAIGSDCLISGPNPECVLEAAHIRSFAEHESHELNGGLLLRRDFHSLFDRRLIRVNPKKWTVEASPAIRKYETYNAIHLREIQPPEKNPPNEQWLMDHYNAAESVFA